MKKIIFIGSIFIIASVLMISAIGNYSSAYAQGTTDFTATLSGKEVVPPVKTDGTGVANFEVSQSSLNYQINVLNAGSITTVQIHSGAVGTNGDVWLHCLNRKVMMESYLMISQNFVIFLQNFLIFLQPHKDLALSLLVVMFTLQI
jgi:hypothetical protein